MFDVILVERAYSDSSYAYVQNGNTDDINSSSSKLTDKIGETARNIGMNIVRGNVYTTDVFSFYRDTNLENQVAKKYECIASEMECFALFHNAQVLGKEAACVLTVVDTIVKRENVSAMEREKKLSDSIELVLKSI